MTVQFVYTSTGALSSSIFLNYGTTSTFKFNFLRLHHSETIDVEPSHPHLSVDDTSQHLIRVETNENRKKNQLSVTEPIITSRSFHFFSKRRRRRRSMHAIWHYLSIKWLGCDWVQEGSRCFLQPSDATRDDGGWRSEVGRKFLRTHFGVLHSTHDGERRPICQSVVGF